jgi:hypothetical protein
VTAGNLCTHKAIESSGIAFGLARDQAAELSQPLAHSRLGEEHRIDQFWSDDPHPRGDEFDLLNAAGADGRELVSFTSNGIAYLKRRIAAEFERGRRIC